MTSLFQAWNQASSRHRVVFLKALVLKEEKIIRRLLKLIEEEEREKEVER